MSSLSYFSAREFILFGPVSVLYTTLAHTFSFLLRLSPKPSPLLPQDCFRLPRDDVNKRPRPIALVTGANTGIGFHTSLSLLHKGYDVILACRSQEKGTRAAEKLNKLVSSGDSNEGATGKAVFLARLDLDSFSSVKTFTDSFYENHSHLNILVNNAGINTSGESHDRLDLCFQTNFIGHYYLTRLLMPALREAKNVYPDGSSERGRVVNLSSVMHHFCRPGIKMNDNENGGDMQDVRWWKDYVSAVGKSDNTYAESKLAMVFFTTELNKRYGDGDGGIRAVSVNPGAVNSDIWRDIPKFILQYVLRPIFSVIFLSSEQGAQTSIVGAVGNLPKKCIYLQPYWQPPSTHQKHVEQSESFARRYGQTFPVFEMLGLYVGHAVTDARLPMGDGEADKCATALWDACEIMVGMGK